MVQSVEHDSNAGALWKAPLADGPLDATVTIPGSKSLSNRYLVLGALSTRPVVLEGMLRSRDTELMMAALEALGVSCLSNDLDPTTVRVVPPDDGVFRGDVDVYCGLAGTVMRFVPPLALFADGPVRFDGDEQAYTRPMKPLLDGLEQLGAAIDYEREPGHLPFTITPPERGALGAGDEAAKVTIDSSASSQFVSGLLLIGSKLPHGLDLKHCGAKLPSMPHIEMTMEDIRLAGGDVAMPVPGQWTVQPAPLALPFNLVVEPDLSNAAPFLGAALIAGGFVSVPHWPAATTQPGALLPGILAAMGADVTLDGKPFASAEDAASFPQRHSGTLTVRGSGTIDGLGPYDMSAAGEIAPSIAALAVLADGDSDLEGIGHLRGHETDRLKALATEIARIGGAARETPDGLAIETVGAGRLHGAVMKSYADHRMATFAAMVGLKVPGIEVENIATTRKTIPDFPGLWAAMLAQKA